MNNLNTQANQLQNRNIEILDATAGYCPNGCLAQCGDGCYCNGSYPNNKEASTDININSISFDIAIHFNILSFD